MHASDVSNLLYQQLSFRGDRQKIIASNIANLNTPDYKTKDLSFDDHLQKVSNNNDLQLYITNKNHISNLQLNSGITKPTAKVYEVQGLEEQNDGNNVNLDKEISKMAKNSVMSDAIANSIKKDNRWFQLVVESSGKN